MLRIPVLPEAKFDHLTDEYRVLGLRACAKTKTPKTTPSLARCRGNTGHKHPAGHQFHAASCRFTGNQQMIYHTTPPVSSGFPVHTSRVWTARHVSRPSKSKTSYRTDSS
ncbi:Hypothetical protein Deide_1p01583 (plasmid) [Deinococcus deserti VCD115]|uniref:Uncharacterized protein n=1 Tax=Deinococcus deserti (strain DSM 17065 / CIP 109153 / LMG 22923 / VCD115) TaxID=546414 RepID=C1D2G6_DEIDV|nr:Hypothetical protein Deide_1p01583 [Deinococcus deserti VCD115]